VFPVRIGLRDPRSQTRDLGHPSVLPFDVAEGTSFVISLPTRLSKAAREDNRSKRLRRTQPRTEVTSLSVFSVYALAN
jgi:hypothetical protein